MLMSFSSACSQICIPRESETSWKPRYLTWNEQLPARTFFSSSIQRAGRVTWPASPFAVVVVVVVPPLLEVVVVAAGVDGLVEVTAAAVVVVAAWVDEDEADVTTPGSSLFDFFIDVDSSLPDRPTVCVPDPDAAAWMLWSDELFFLRRKLRLRRILSMRRVGLGVRSMPVVAPGSTSSSAMYCCPPVTVPPPPPPDDDFWLRRLRELRRNVVERDARNASFPISDLIWSL